MLGDWATFFLALLLIPVLYVEETSHDGGAVQLATWANALIWLVFVVDYALDLRRAPDQRAYVRSHWADLALIAVSPPILVPPELQALRVLRALRLFRALAVGGVVWERLGRPLTRNAALALLAILGIVILAGGIAIRAAEPEAIVTLVQGYAWTVSALVTLGHPTPEPATVAGRALSAAIVVVGVGTFAALAASVGARPRAR